MKVNVANAATNPGQATHPPRTPSRSGSGTTPAPTTSAAQRRSPSSRATTSRSARSPPTPHHSGGRPLPHHQAGPAAKSCRPEEPPQHSERAIGAWPPSGSGPCSRGCRSAAPSISVGCAWRRSWPASIAEFARHSPGFYDDIALVDSTPVECARSVETTRRSQLADAADYAGHSRFFWGFRLHALFALDGTPRALALTSPKVDEKTVCLQLV